MLLSENALRRRADKMGYRLIKSRGRNWSYNNQLGYMIADVDTGGAVAGWLFDFDLADVQQWLAA